MLSRRHVLKDDIDFGFCVIFHFLVACDVTCRCSSVTLRTYVHEKIRFFTFGYGRTGAISLDKITLPPLLFQRFYEVTYNVTAPIKEGILSMPVKMKSFANFFAKIQHLHPRTPYTQPSTTKKPTHKDLLHHDRS